jgi:hypothetical protein
MRIGQDVCGLPRSESTRPTVIAACDGLTSLGDEIGDGPAIHVFGRLCDKEGVDGGFRRRLNGSAPPLPLRGRVGVPSPRARSMNHE